MTSAVSSNGTTFAIKTGGSTFTTCAGLTGFSGLNSGAAAIMDTTNLASSAKEKLVGIVDEGSISLDFNYIGTDAGQIALDAGRIDRALHDFKITLPDTASYAFSGFVMTTAKTTGVDAVIKLAATIEISGAITHTAAA